MEVKAVKEFTLSDYLWSILIGSLIIVPLVILAGYLSDQVLGYSGFSGLASTVLIPVIVLCTMMGVLFAASPQLRTRIDGSVLLVSYVIWPCLYLAFTVSEIVTSETAATLMLCGVFATTIWWSGAFFVASLNARRRPVPAGFARKDHIPPAPAGLMPIPPSHHRAYAGLEERSLGTEPPPNSLIRSRR